MSENAPTCEQLLLTVETDLADGHVRCEMTPELARKYLSRMNRVRALQDEDDGWDLTGVEYQDVLDIFAGAPMGFEIPDGIYPSEMIEAEIERQASRYGGKRGGDVDVADLDRSSWWVDGDVMLLSIRVEDSANIGTLLYNSAGITRATLLRYLLRVVPGAEVEEIFRQLAQEEPEEALQVLRRGASAAHFFSEDESVVEDTPARPILPHIRDVSVLQPLLECERPAVRTGAIALLGQIPSVEVAGTPVF